MGLEPGESRVYVVNDKIVNVTRLDGVEIPNKEAAAIIGFIAVVLALGVGLLWFLV